MVLSVFNGAVLGIYFSAEEYTTVYEACQIGPKIIFH